MVGLSTIFATLLPIFCLAFVGWFLRWKGGVTQEGEQSLMRVVVNLLFPAFIFEFVVGNPLLKDPAVLVEAGLAGFLSICLGCAVAYGTARLFGISRGDQRRTFSVVTGVHNFGYVAIPVARIFFDSETIGVMLVVNTGIDLAIWTVCVAILTGRFDKKAIKRAFNAPVLSLIIAAGLNFADAEKWLPDFFMVSIGMLGPCAIPIGIVMIGTTFYGLSKQLVGNGLWRVGFTAIGTRQLLMPVLMLLLIKLLPLSTEVKQVLLIHAAMPTAVFPVVLAKYYGGCTVTAIQSVVPCTIISLLTIPLWIQFGLWWLSQ